MLSFKFLSSCWFFIGANCTIFARRTYKNSTFLTTSPSKMKRFWRVRPMKMQQFCKAHLWKFNNFDCQPSENESFLKGAPYENSTILKDAPMKIQQFWLPALQKWIIFEGCTLRELIFLKGFCDPLQPLCEIANNAAKLLKKPFVFAAFGPLAVRMRSHSPTTNVAIDFEWPITRWVGWEQKTSKTFKFKYYWDSIIVFCTRIEKHLL